MYPRPSPSTHSAGKLPAERPAQLEKRLFAYALGAAGIFAIAQPAAADIVYTKVNVTLSNGILPIDLDRDGRTDFALHNYWAGSSSSVQVITIKGNPTDSAAAVIGKKKFFQYAFDAPLNYLIGSGITKSFVNLAGDRAYLGGGISNKYLGLRFQISGQIHYG
jgi:hypothetical protein